MEKKMEKTAMIGPVVILTIIFGLSTLYAQPMGPGYGMGSGMMGWGNSGTGWMWHILMTAFWIAVIVGIVFLIRWLVISTRSVSEGTRLGDSSLEILKKRYARGEINKDEFKEKRNDLME